MRRGCRGGLSHHRIVLADGNTTGLNNITNSVLDANLSGRKNLEKEADVHLVPVSC